MALGEYSFLTWKSKAAQESEQKEYAKWAFPFGEKQREKLQALLLSVFPGESVPGTLIPFLTCKELYENIKQKTGSQEEAVDALINKQKKYKQLIKKKDMATYVALVLADADIDEQCNYPPADEIRARVAAYKRLHPDITTPPETD